MVLWVGFSTAEDPAPHIIFIMVDDMGWNDIGYRTTTELVTPTLTDLATKDGVRLERYYTGPTCGPTRSQFLSGKYSIHLGLHDSNLPACTNEELNSTLDTVADKMKQEGYTTHMIGKWHAGFSTPEHFPTERGFDTFRGFLLSHQSNHFNRKARYEGNLYYDYHDVDENGVRTSPYKADDNVYSTTAATNRAVDLINAHDADTSMFMYLAYQSPHTPVETDVPDPYDSVTNSIPIQDRKEIASMLLSIDAGVGEVLAALKNNSMYDNSYIIFTSDNGGANGAGSSTYPLRGNKGSWYDGGIRNIGFVHSPLMSVADDTERSSMIHVTDWMPTFMHIARGESVDGAALGIDGVDQFSAITSGAEARTEMLHDIKRRQDGNKATLRTNIRASMMKIYNGEMYKILTGTQAGGLHYPNPMDDYDYWDSFRSNATYTAGGSTVELYNLSQDPNEEDDLSDESAYDSIQTDLLTVLRDYERGSMDPITTVYYNSQGTGECDPSLNGNVFSDYL